jgi:hypothetical protein
MGSISHPLDGPSCSFGHDGFGSNSVFQFVLTPSRPGESTQPAPPLLLHEPEWTVHSAEQPADANRDHSGRIGRGLNSTPEPLFQRRSRIADSVGGVRRGVAGLPVQVLRRSCRLVCDSSTWLLVSPVIRPKPSSSRSMYEELYVRSASSPVQRKSLGSSQQQSGTLRSIMRVVHIESAQI